MSYASALVQLHALGGELQTVPGTPRRKFELAHMRTLMAALSNAERGFNSILVAGTNGKGSTSSTLASILHRAGYRTGLYTSPHLSRINERIQVNGATISDDDLAALFFRVEEVAARLVRDGHLPAAPSFFETVTAMGFLYFAAQGVHTAVVEVGMGGRLDATNIVEPILSVITDISLDHTEWLGSTVEQITREKAGILRRNGVMVTLPQHPEANQALGEVAVALDVRGVNAANYIPVHNHPEQYTRNRYPLSVMEELIEIDSPLAGAHQQRNLALAIAAAVDLKNSHGYNITPVDVQAGIHDTVWPARLELISGHGIHADVLLDVGHNPAGAWALRAAVSRLEQIQNENRPMTLVFGCLKDKPAAELAQILFPLFQTVVVTPVDSPRSASVDDLTSAARITGSEAEIASNAPSAVERALQLTPVRGLVVVTGSVYLVGEVRPLLIRGTQATPNSSSLEPIKV
jgi:dihydrofolate synthase / folylpolyglutamate synthase